MRYEGLDRLRYFVVGVGDVLETVGAGHDVGGAVAPLMADLVATDDWLPAEYAEGDPARYRQYLLHCDSRERFSVVSFVWMPGQSTPVHDHGVWGVIGMLRGAELSRRYRMVPEAGVQPTGELVHLEPGDVEILSPQDGDIHQVQSAAERDTSVSIHIYGGNIGRIKRRSFGENGQITEFISGYSNQSLPNIWS